MDWKLRHNWLDTVQLITILFGNINSDSKGTLWTELNWRWSPSLARRPTSCLLILLRPWKRLNAISSVRIFSAKYLTPLSSAGSNPNFLSKLERKNRSEVEYDENLLVKSSSNRFSRLMKFLAKYKEIIENRSPDIKAGSGKTFTSFVTGMTFRAKATLGVGRTRQDDAKSSSRIKPCLACDDVVTNRDSIFHMLADCGVWKSLSLRQK